MMEDIKLKYLNLKKTIIEKIKIGKMAQWIIIKIREDMFKASLLAPNGQTICSTEIYSSVKALLIGLDSIKKYSNSRINFDNV